MRGGQEGVTLGEDQGALLISRTSAPQELRHPAVVLSSRDARMLGDLWCTGAFTFPAVPVNKVILVRRRLHKLVSDGWMDGQTSQRCGILQQPLRPARSSERGPAARGLADGEDRNGSVLRRPVGIGGEDRQPGAQPRSVPDSVARSRAAGERCRRGTGGAASRGSRQSTHVEPAAGDLR